MGIEFQEGEISMINIHTVKKYIHGFESESMIKRGINTAVKIKDRSRRMHYLP